MPHASDVLENGHLEALRAVALELHRQADDLKQRRGATPPDRPAGYVDALVKELGILTELCARELTCGQAKQQALDLVRGRDIARGSAEEKAVNGAIASFFRLINQHARRCGVDPFARTV